MSDLYTISTKKEDLKFAIVNNMQKYGGSFVQQLAKCAICADPINYQKLQLAFQNYFDEYNPDNWAKEEQSAIDWLKVKKNEIFDRLVLKVEKIFQSKEFKQVPFDCSYLSEKGKEELKKLLSENRF